MHQAMRTLGALPPEPTPLLGREDELERVLALLGRDEVRMLTLTGAGGVGKTRLAARAAALAAEGFADGVLFVPLESTTDASLVPSAIALHLGLSDVGERSRLEEVVRHLGEREVLLVLDGFEHLLDGAPVLVELLSGCERVKLVVTSRAVLRLSGEQEFRVRELDASPAVALFVQRATAVEPDFRLTPEAADAVTAICGRLDGLPLALELAAARVRLLRPEAMLSQLSRRFELLTGGPRDAPARQQTMRDTVAWSYGLLDARERRVFRLLSVFVGGCSLEAAEQVAAGAGGAEALFETLASLVDKSMVTRMEGPGGEARVGMLETLRAFAHDELLATGELEAAGAAHTEWCVALAVEAGPATTGPDQRAWLDRLEAELPNLRAALRRMLDGGRHAEALAVACDLERLWFVRGHLAEGRRWIAEALAGVPQEGALATRALALAATLAHYGGELGVAEDEAGRAVAAAAGLGAHPDRAEALAALGLMDRALGRYPDAERRYGEAIAILREADRPARLAETLGRRAILGMLAQDFAAAIERGEEAVRVARAAGDIASIAYAGPPVAISLLMTGDDAGAQAVLDEALAATRALGNRRHASRALWALGLVALRRGEPARALIEEACALGGEFGDDVFLTFAIPELARAHIAEGGPEPAVRLLAAASAFRAATGAAPVVWFQEEHERAIETARAALGEDRFAAVWREGEAMTPDEAFVSGRDAAGDPGPEQEGDAPEPEELTAREAEVLILVARGLTDAQVAAELVLSRRTVHAHLRAVYRKLDVGSRHAATRWALERGMA